MENSGRGRLMQFATEEVKFSRQFSELKENKKSKDIYKKTFIDGQGMRRSNSNFAYTFSCPSF